MCYVNSSMLRSERKSVSAKMLEKYEKPIKALAVSCTMFVFVVREAEARIDQNYDGIKVINPSTLTKRDE